MSKIISISIDEESLKAFDVLVEQNYTDRSKLLRRWIEEHKQEE